MTNAEKLAKDTEVFASMIEEYNHFDCNDCPAKEECEKWDIEDCHDFLVWWLEQEAEEDERNILFV